MKDLDFKQLEQGVARADFPERRGVVTAVSELFVEARFPGARTGQQLEIAAPGSEPLVAEVAACQRDEVRLVPFGSTAGIGPGDVVRASAAADRIPAGRGLLGRIIDPLGRPLDGGGPLEDVERWPLERPAPNPLTRGPITEQLITGNRMIDGCLSLGYGQRVGLFAGPGLGKTTLVGAFAARAACDVNVIALIGERGREVREFIDDVLGAEGLARSVVVLAGADAPPSMRVRALQTATALAEWYRARGDNALLLVDSLTRVVRARRDIALALGEEGSRGGYPPSAFAQLPALVERTGLDSNGSITAVYAVLTEQDDDPVAEEVRSLVDGHIVLSARYARKGIWPPIDLLHSLSRVMGAVATAEQREAADTLRQMIGAYEVNEDLILIGAYQRGTAPMADRALERMESIRSFWTQPADRSSYVEQTRRMLAELVE